MTTFDTDPNTQTVASAWASSALGQPDSEVGFGIADESATERMSEPTDDADTGERRRPVAKHAIIAAALACGIGAGAALGLTVYDFSPHQPTVTVPTTPGHAVIVEGNTPASAVPQSPSAANAPGRVGIPPAGVPGGAAIAPQPGPAPVPEQPENPPMPAPESQEDPQVPAPEPPEDPQDPDPKPWQPPVVVDDFKLPEPQPNPDPQPPVVVDDFKLPDPPQPEPDPGPIFSPPLKTAP
jgi:hypothetical protein